MEGKTLRKPLGTKEKNVTKSVLSLKSRMFITSRLIIFSTGEIRLRRWDRYWEEQGRMENLRFIWREQGMKSLLERDRLNMRWTGSKWDGQAQHEIDRKSQNVMVKMECLNLYGRKRWNKADTEQKYWNTEDSGNTKQQE